MKNNLTRTFIFFISILIVPSSLNAQQSKNLSFTCSYPSPIGSYTRLMLSPRANIGLTCNAANEGMFYVRNTPAPSQLFICLNDGFPPTGFNWVSLLNSSNGNVWTQSVDGNNIYPTNITNNALKVGIGVTTPDIRSTVQIQFNHTTPNTPITDYVGTALGGGDLRLPRGPELRLFNNRTRSSSQIVFGNAEWPALDTFRIKYHAQGGDSNTPTGSQNNWLEFWGLEDCTANPPCGISKKINSQAYPIMTLQRDYNPAQNQFAGVGIGVPPNFNVSSTLEVRGSPAAMSTEDILRLMNDTTRVFQVLNDGKIGIGSGFNSGLNPSTPRVTIRPAANSNDFPIEIFSSNAAAARALRMLANGSVIIGPDNGPIGTALLSVYGQIAATGTITPSDMRLKKNIHILSSSLNKIQKLQGVSFQWKNPEKFGNDTKVKFGFIAQEVEKIFPEWVGTDNEGFKTLSITDLNALLVESIKELNSKIDKLSKEVDALKKENQRIKKGK